MKLQHLFVAAITVALLSGCGGGGGSSSPATSTSTPATRNLGGVAAVGSPIVAGTINVSCASGSALASTTTSSMGAWQVTLAGQTLPCAVQVTGGTISGVANTTPYQSIAITPGTVNVTPLTDLMVANLAGTATPSVWFAGLSANPAPLTAINQASVTGALAKMSAALPALTSLNTINPIITAFTPTSGNVSDDMLTALKTAMTNTGVTYTSLLSNASVPAFTAPVTGFGTALATAYAGTTSGGGTATQVPIAAVIQGNVYIDGNLVNLSTGVLTPQTPVMCGGISSAAVGADGVAIGSQVDGSIVKFDPVSGNCTKLFTAPEWIGVLAIAPDGTIVGQSQASLFGVNQIYRFSSSGVVLSKVALSGVSDFTGFSYAPNGHLYGASGFSWFELNPITGNAVSQFSGTQLGLGISQVCIDSAGTAYAQTVGVLSRYNAITGALLGSITLQRDLGLPAIICR